MLPLLRYVGFAVLTFLAGLAGRATFEPELGFSLIWPMHGVGVLWLATGTRRSRPWDLLGLAVAATATGLVLEGSWERAVFGVVATLTAVVSWVWVVRRFASELWGAGGSRPLGRRRDLGALVGACLLAAGVAAVERGVGLGLLPAVGVVDTLLLGIRNLSWLLAISTLGLLVLPQPDLGLPAFWRGLRRRGLRLLEIAAVLVAWFGLTVVLFAPDPPPYAFPILLGAVWAAFRLPAPAALLTVDLVGTYAVIATFAGLGPFAVGAPFESAVIAQAFVITLVVPTLMIAFVTSERREATARALSAERESATRAALFAAVVEHLDEGVSVIDADDTYVVRNPAIRAMSGPGGFLHAATGRRGRQVIVDEHGQPLSVAQMPHSRARAGESVVRETLRVRQRDGSLRFLEVTSVAVSGVNDDTRPVVVNTLRDVTREREERDQLVSFAGVVAHDLKNPLTVVRGWLENLLDELEADHELDRSALVAMVSRVQGASGEMRRFIDDLLGFTVARDRPLTLEPLDLSALAEEVAELRRAGESRARVTVDPGLTATGDRVLVRQLLDNLIGNAVKYVAPGVRPQVRVTGRVTDDDVEISVVDNGIGIPPEARTRVFDSFARAHADGYSGTGLGLAICQRVVTRHGGRIWVEDTGEDAASGGSTFTFTLPRGS